ncbi:MAG: indolepyruvate ferredoxin oxidoreductase family protein [Blastomonas sp.]|jgi:indolepyruvate ferredoxin oxidoreductase|uniref:indolepyruvate ferredoxin oxidoreductase family protein n=1 Tax=Blastomonas sp. TaxID=1909299 RepID=UPI00258DAD09|nr:indolepyruvate ferredoxin oxidoreductase family protein [Blastomonas sp.]MCO5792548.1 indolepyruvate ferredoxin oxidoreductase family protein [Blastomonas sp.]
MDEVALLSGTQALVRLLALQRDRDRAAGLDTRGFVSGYRGSPLGGLDSELEKAKRGNRLEAIHFEPGLNEDLAATAVAGTQQIGQLDATCAGVFAMWYGKGPGVDRSADALRHGNLAGSSPNGGALVVFGDDHPGKSSTVPNQSEPLLAALGIPVLYPADVTEVITFGLAGWHLSRFSGAWVGLKLVNETAETTGTVDLQRLRAFDPSLPTVKATDASAVHFTGTYAPLQHEAVLVDKRLPLVRLFSQANRLDRIERGALGARLAIVTAGKTYGDVCEALDRIGLDDAGCRDAGILVYKAGLIWPLDTDTLLASVGGVAEILVVEEKRGVLEDQIAAAIVNRVERPILTGKRDEAGRPQFSSWQQLDPAMVARVIAARMDRLQLPRPAQPMDQERLMGTPSAVVPARLPYFCSGCPHNRSTNVPEGAVALGGIGCHGMAMWMNRTTLPPVQMGGEGANWIGAAPFVERTHIFQNLGDGTFSHSALLAVRAAVNAKVNITFKILHNDAVAMTGGQPLEGALTAPDIARQVLAAGVRRCVVVTDQPDALAGTLPEGVTLFDRAELEAVQSSLAKTEGTTVLIYSQVCATELRRRRKRGLAPTPEWRFAINPEVCEGCGDCTAKSNCMSILPLETPLGRKRQIDQSSCNLDASCVDGFCPSFVSIRPDGVAKASEPVQAAGDLPAPGVPSLGDRPFSILFAGIGGTGVVTLSTILAAAAEAHGFAASSFNMTGLAQKGGAVVSHLRITRTARAAFAARIASGAADTVLVCDPIAGAGAEALQAIHPTHSRVILNRHAPPTASFQLDRDAVTPSREAIEAISGCLNPDNALRTIDADHLARTLFDDAAMANVILLGFACQHGALPLPPEAIEAAIGKLGLAVERNLAAFRAGRAHAAGGKKVLERAPEPVPTGLDEIIAHRRALLTAYQNHRYAGSYEAFVRTVAAREQASVGGTRLAEIVASNLAKLMAYKDEYEVARLYSGSTFLRDLRQQYGDASRLRFHLAPPALGWRDRKGTPRKRTFGPWILVLFRLLAAMRRLRHTPLDPFGHTRERRRERDAIAEYQRIVSLLLQRLTPETHASICTVARYPEQIRGFGHVKQRAHDAAVVWRNERLAEFAMPGQQERAHAA